MAQKVNPYFGNPGDDPAMGGLLQNIKMNIDALMRWARLVEGQLEAIKSVIRQQESDYAESTMEMLSSIEAICVILKDADIDITKFSSIQSSFKEKINMEREKAIQALAEKQAAAEKPQIWVPDKKLIPGK